MKTCNDCIHQELCDVYSRAGVTDVAADDISICELFKNKADVVEVRRGEWSVAIGYDPARRVMCDLCQRMNYEPTNFCPNCGADMRGERKE